MQLTSHSFPEGQLSAAERTHIGHFIRQANPRPQVCIEIGTWLGGGSTLHILKALYENNAGHLWGIEADRSIFERMLVNIRTAFPQGADRFTPLFGLPQPVLPEWLATLGDGGGVDFAFLDGGDNPAEQILEFRLLDPRMPVGSQLMAHDAYMRKGKWLVPYLSRLDNWDCQLLDGSDLGLLYARKLKLQPSWRSRQRAEWHLRLQRVHPVEFAAAVLPATVRRWLADTLPRCVRWYTTRKRHIGFAPKNPSASNDHD